MDRFDIGRLTDFDFEAVCKDLFEEQLAVQLELFAPGKDQGIDLRHFSPKTKDLMVIQCKHWDKKASAALIRHMENVELPKVKKLHPQRYILATSVDLSVNDTNKLYRLLQPHMVSPGDIYGLRDIEAMLRTSPAIVQRHLRLWLSSTGVLQSLLNKRTITRSADLADDIKQAALLYVPNDSYSRAQELLEKRHYCIIAGLPGIGKTTLARILSGTYAATGYDIFEISEDADEINNLWDPDVPQFFYYDDFLGQTTLADKLHKNEDSRLVRLFDRIERTANKRLVLTTREYILEQARQNYERLETEDLHPLTCVVDLGDYTPLIRARILYNHIFFSGLSAENRAHFANPTTYLPIIEHPNFNPRLIERSLRKSISDGDHGHAVQRDLLDNLTRPNRLWEHIVSRQLDALSVDLLTVLYSLDGNSYLRDLHKALSAYVGAPLDNRSLRRSLSVLESTMLKVTPTPPSHPQHHRGPRIEFHNPSIRDYMKEFISEHADTVEKILRAAPFFEQIVSIWTMAHGTNGETIRSHLKAAVGVLSEAIVRTYDSPAIGLATYRSTDGFIISHEADMVHRLSFLLQVLEEIDSSNLLRFAIERLSTIELYSAIYDPAHLVEAVRTIWKSPIPEISQHAERVLEEAIEWLLADLGTRENIEYAQSWLIALGEIVPEEVHETIEEAFERDARVWLDLFLLHGKFTTRDLHDVRTVINRLENMYGETDDVMSAKNALRRAEREAAKDIPPPPEALPKVDKSVTTAIRELFSSLRET
ncbi:restriction endonuclease [Microbispora triticiradicis]|uniref:nSTAND3 domain-containing NTPase n=1 Tax=Microbispora TaxID=2005 RepID=UPI00142ED5DF|nr:MULTISPECIES: restriction endonuclease [Microbispora]